MYSFCLQAENVSPRKIKTRQTIICIACTILLAGITAHQITHAQTRPDAGSVLQQIERDRVPQRVPTAPN